MSSPFTPFRGAPRPAKVLLYGEPGTEKTRRCLLQLPHPIAYIDMEASAAAYGDLADPRDQLLVTRRLRGPGSVLEAVSWVESHPGDFASVVIDPITTVWDQLQAAFRERLAARRKDRPHPDDIVIEPSHWNALNTAHGDILARLQSLPQHVVLVGRGKWGKDEQTGKRTDYDYEGWKRVPSLVSTVIESHPDYDVVHKDRFGVLRPGRQARVTLEGLCRTGTEAAPIEAESDAAQADAGPQMTAGQSKAVAALAELGLSAPEGFGAPHAWSRDQLKTISAMVQQHRQEKA